MPVADNENKNEEVKQEPVTPPAGDDKKEEWLKLKKEKENWKQKAIDLENTLKLAADARLKEKEDFKALYENEQKEKNELKLQIEEAKKNEIKNKKAAFVKSEFAKNGAHGDSIDMLVKLVDIEAVKYDPETGAIWGHEDSVKAVKEKMPMVFGTNPAAPNQSAPNVNTQVFDFAKLSGKDLTKKDTLAMAFKQAGIELKK